jgi:hypothetical protein
MRQLQWKTWTRVECDAVATVDRQLHAYNERDLQALLACFAPEICVYEVGTEAPVLRGIEALREKYEESFKKNPAVYASLERREVHDRFVTDFERLSGLQDGHDRRIKVIYEVRGAQIVRIWYMKAMA